MITFLEGILVEKEPMRAVINVGGVGYEVHIPLSSFDRLPPPDAPCRILTYDHVREDVHALYGFMTEAERKLFLLLISVSGIGPKSAMSALSGLSVREFIAAIAGNDTKRLSSISGIGKKTAERLILELKGKLQAAPVALGKVSAPAAPAPEGHAELLTGALTRMGFRPVEAERAVTALGARVKTEPLGDLVRDALSLLSKK